MTRFLPKDIIPAIKSWVYFTRCFLYAPLTFTKTDEVKISPVWRFISLGINIPCTIMFVYITVVIGYPDDIKSNPLLVVGYGRKISTSILTVVSIFEIARNVKLLANVINNFLKINLVLPLDQKKKIICVGIVAFECFFMATMLSSHIRGMTNLDLRDDIMSIVKIVFLTIVVPPTMLIDMNVINAVGLTGFFVEMYKIELQKLSSMTKSEFYSSEILFLKQK